MLALAGVLLSLVAVWAVLWSGWLGVQRVAVSGVSRLTAHEVVAAADIRPGRALATLDTDAVRRRVAVLPAVASVQIRRAWPTTVQIAVQERQPVAAVVGADPRGSAGLVDRTGVVFATVPARPALLTPVQAAAPVPGQGTAALRAAVDVLTTLPTPLRRQVAEVSAPSPAGITLRLTGGRQVVWGGPQQTARKAAVLAALLKAPATGPRPTVYDVRTPDVAVTR